MSVSKMVGWLLIVVGIARVFQAVHLQAAGASQAFLISLLLAGGAALLWIGGAPRQPGRG